jgi:hypothetical protein
MVLVVAAVTAGGAAVNRHLVVLDIKALFLFGTLVRNVVLVEA